MGRTIKVRCNGPGKHINEVDVDKCLEKQPVHKGSTAPVSERMVLNCRECTEGKVIVTSDMIGVQGPLAGSGDQS